MKTPKIELKKVRFGAEATHEETLNFSAEVYLDGKLIGYATNDGRGGMTCVRGYKEGDYQLIGETKKAFAALPEVYNEQFKKSYKQSLDEHIDDLVYKVYNEKQEEKINNSLKRKTVNHLIMISPNKTETVSIKFHQPIANYLADPKGKETILNKIAKMKAEFPTYTLINDIK